jgi:hypothetical protein
MPKRLKFVITDGGRAAAGFTGRAGDCVARSLAIITGRPYQEIYDRLAKETGSQRRGKYTGHRISSASHGINTGRKWFKDYMRELGFVWVPTMGIGTGCTVHLRADELPMGRLVVSVSKHFTAVIDRVGFDTHNPDRGGRRCVYGYWRLDRG